MLRVVCVVVVFSLSGCVIGGEMPEVPVADLAPPALQLPAVPQGPLVQVLTPTKEELASLCVDVVPPKPAPVEMSRAVPVKPARPPKPEPVISPTALVQQAQKTASVGPDKRAYYGGSGETAYLYQAGKIYDVYLAPNVSTPIALPPGERQVSGILLNPEQFMVEPVRAGKDANAYDVFSIHPKVESGEFQTHIVTESGRRYLLRLIVGKVGMAAVTFELAQR